MAISTTTTTTVTTVRRPKRVRPRVRVVRKTRKVTIRQVAVKGGRVRRRARATPV